MNRANISGLVNTENNVILNKNLKQNFIREYKEAYIEFRIHSKIIKDNNGDKWMVFPRINNNNVSDLIAALLSDEETKLYFYTITKNSVFFKDNIEQFQKQFNKYFSDDNKNNLNSMFSARCGFPGQPPCSIEEITIVVQNTNNGGYYSITGGGHEEGGGGCASYLDCESNTQGGGGGSLYIDPPNSDPCSESQSAANNATAYSKTSAYINAEIAITGMNNGKENGVVLGNVNGSIQSTEIQTGGVSSIENLTHNFSDPIGDIHNHPNNNPPSPGDVYSLINSQNQFSNYNTRYVITENGTTYALVVTDINAMNVFLNNYPPDQAQPGISPNFPDQLFYEWADLKNSFSNSGALAYILKKYNSGIALTKMDEAGNFRTVNITTIQNADGLISYNYSFCPN